MRRLENDLDQQEDGGDTDALTGHTDGQGCRRYYQLASTGNMKDKSHLFFGSIQPGRRGDYVYNSRLRKQKRGKLIS